MQQWTRQTLLIYLEHALRYRGQALFIISGVLIAMALDLVRPIALKYLFDTFTLPTGWALWSALTILGIWSALGLLRYVIWRLIGKSNNKFQPRVISDLMNTCYEYMLKHSYGFYTNNFAGSIQTKVRKFAYAFEAVADQVCFDLGRSLLAIGCMVVILLIYFWQIGLMMLVWVVAYFTFTYIFAKYKLKYDIAQSEQDTVVTAHLADTLSNHSNINLFSAHDREVNVFREITDTLYKLRKKSWDLGLIAEVFQGISMISLEITVMIYIVYSLHGGVATVGDVLFAQAYMSRLFENTWNMGRHIRKVYEQLANANEMTEMLFIEHEVKDVSPSQVLTGVNGQVSFVNVGFGYQEHQRVFSDFSLDIRNGEKVALVGPSGAGKSTIVKMLLRYAEVNFGQILIDGQDISQVTQSSLHEQVTLVPQDPSLFHRSLYDNIRYGKPDATMEEVVEASRMAHCHDFIMGFEEGYDTLVGERGVKLSGGERQRVAIARAILRNCPILVLDEATSSLDSESETYIQAALHNLMKDKTVLVIAHRLSTIREMDRIVVIEKGQIIEQGSHQQLLAELNGTYQKLWNIQVGGFIPNVASA